MVIRHVAPAHLCAPRRIRAEASSSQPSFQAPLTPDLLRSVYSDVELATENIRRWAAERGFQIMVRSCSGSNRYIGCRRARYPKGNAKSYASDSPTSYTKCPYSIRIAPSEEFPSSWTLKQINPLHNHAPLPDHLGPDPTTDPAHRPAKRRLVLNDHGVRPVPEAQHGAQETREPTPRPPSPDTHMFAPLEFDDDDESVASTATPFQASLHPDLRAQPGPTSAQASTEADSPDPPPRRRAPRAPASIAASDVSIHTAVSARSDAFAAGHLISLGISAHETPTAPIDTHDHAAAVPSQTSPASAAPPTSSQLTSTVHAAAESGGAAEAVPADAVDARLALRLVLNHTPSDCMLRTVASLDQTHTKAAHAWVQYLKTMLELHVCIFDSPSIRPPASPAPSSELGAQEALVAVLQQPPMHLTMQEVGKLDKVPTQSALRWVKELLAMLELHSTLVGSCYLLVDTASEQGRASSTLGLVASLDGAHAEQAIRWVEALRQVLGSHLDRLDSEA